MNVRDPRRRAVRALVVLMFATVAAAARGAGPPSFEAFLRGPLRLSAEELRDLGRGQTVAKSLDSRNSHEVAAVGVVRLKVLPALFLERFRDIARFKSDEAVLQIGKFSSPPRLEDVQSLVWDPDDLRAFGRCRVGDCEVRLSSDAIGRFQREIDWSSPQRDQQAMQLGRRLLVELATAYLRDGDSSLHSYDDRTRPVSPLQEFRALVDESPSPMSLAPEFRGYLVGFPHSPLPRTSNFLYWSKEKIGPRSVVTVTHVVMYEPASPVAVIIGSRQIYASRYFDASLGVTAMVDARTRGGGEAFDLIYLNRSRTDALEGLWGPLKRTIVRSRARAAMNKYLELLKTRLEGELRASETPQ